MQDKSCKERDLYLKSSFSNKLGPILSPAEGGFRVGKAKKGERYYTSGLPSSKSFGG